MKEEIVKRLAQARVENSNEVVNDILVDVMIKTENHLIDAEH